MKDTAANIGTVAQESKEETDVIPERETVSKSIVAEPEMASINSSTIVETKSVEPGTASASSARDFFSGMFSSLSEKTEPLEYSPIFKKTSPIIERASSEGEEIVTEFMNDAVDDLAEVALGLGIAEVGTVEVEQILSQEATTVSIPLLAEGGDIVILVDNESLAVDNVITEIVKVKDLGSPLEPVMSIATETGIDVQDLRRQMLEYVSNTLVDRTAEEVVSEPPVDVVEKVPEDVVTERKFSSIESMERFSFEGLDSRSEIFASLPLQTERNISTVDLEEQMQDFTARSFSERMTSLAMIELEDEGRGRVYSADTEIDSLRGVSPRSPLRSLTAEVDDLRVISPQTERIESVAEKSVSFDPVEVEISAHSYKVSVDVDEIPAFSNHVEQVSNEVEETEDASQKTKAVSEDVLIAELEEPSLVEEPTFTIEPIEDALFDDNKKDLVEQELMVDEVPSFIEPIEDPLIDEQELKRSLDDDNEEILADEQEETSSVEEVPSKEICEEDVIVESLESTSDTIQPSIGAFMSDKVEPSVAEAKRNFMSDVFSIFSPQFLRETESYIEEVAPSPREVVEKTHSGFMADVFSIVNSRVVEPEVVISPMAELEKVQETLISEEKVNLVTLIIDVFSWGARCRYGDQSCA